jgi:hypothetical protein
MTIRRLAMTFNAKKIQGSIKTGGAIALIALALWLISPAASLAQQSTATMFGNVVDATGAAIPGATVVLTQTATNFKRETKTNALGEYRAEFLPVGPYTVSIELRASRRPFSRASR